MKLLATTLLGVVLFPAVVMGSNTCGVPVTAGPVPLTSDCLHILRTAIGSLSCPNCVCDLDSSNNFDATDALFCIRKAVGIDVAFVCPPCCGDAVLESAEECDDGNVTNDDGCSAFCVLEDERGLCKGIAESAAPELALELVAEGLDRPVHAAAPPLDPRRLFVVEQTGQIRIIKDGALLADAFLDIHDKVNCCGERGLLSVAFHPEYENNGWFFVNYTRGDGATVVERYRASQDDADTAVPGSAATLLTIAQPFANHNGGQLAFGPDDLLYVGMGDGGSGGDPLEAGQSESTLLGKVLRLDVDVAEEPFYRVPPDNPEPGLEGDLALIWAKGVRNPWRFSFDRVSAQAYVADVGQGRREEVTVITSGGDDLHNLGWDIFEGLLCFEPAPANVCPDPQDGFVEPVLEYDHGNGCSITGGFVYRGCALPSLRGTYFYADYCRDFVRTFRLVAGAATEQTDVTAALAPGQGRDLGSISSFGENARGELHIMDHLDGELFKIVPAP